MGVKIFQLEHSVIIEKSELLFKKVKIINI